MNGEVTISRRLSEALYPVAYLEPIRNRMQKPVEGLPAFYVAALNKGL
jgi:hypothetical protein